MPRERIRIPDELAAQIERALPADRGRLRARVRGMLRRGDTPAIRRSIGRDIEDSGELWARRRSLVPAITYPEL